MDHLELFNAQLRVLKETDYSHLLLQKLEEQQIDVLAKAGKADIPKSRIPFLPVLPRLAFRFSELMPQIINYPSFGETTFVKPKQLLDIVSVPQEDPYYIFDVCYGKDTFGKTPKQSGEALKSAGRRSLTALEGLALFMHCGDLPQSYCLWTLNSRLRIANQSYYVALLIHRRELQRIYFTPNPNSEVKDFGPYLTPSCQP